MLEAEFNSPFINLHLETARLYAESRANMTEEQRRQGVVSLMLASYFAATVMEATPMQLFTSAISAQGRVLTDEQVRTNHDRVTGAPGRYGFVVGDAVGRVQLVPALEVLINEAFGPEKQRHQFIVDNITTFKARILPRIDY